MTLKIRLGLEGAPIHEEVRRQSDDSVIYSSSYLAGIGALGLLF
jgi:hypothetical protein